MLSQRPVTTISCKKIRAIKTIPTTKTYKNQAVKQAAE